MSFTREKIRDFYLLTTEVENIFINEYMPAASGEYVKVYLYGLLYSQNDGMMTYERMSQQLNMSEKQINEAWDYWEKMGVVTKTSDKTGKTKDYDIEFKQLRALMYSVDGSESEDKEEQNAEKEDNPLCDNELKDLLLNIESIMGKLLSPRETKEIFSWMEDVHATSEVILCAVQYCVEKGKTGINYISKVIEQWTKDGLETEEDVERHLDALDQRFAIYKRILQALGLNRGATEGERRMIDSWLDEMNFNMDRVMEACSRAAFIANPNLRYVNKVLQNWYEEAKIDGRDVNKKIKVTQADLNRYYEYLRKKAQEDAEKRRQEVYDRIPRIKTLDEELIALGKKLSRNVLGGNSEEAAESKRLIGLLEQEREVLLTENNYREDYTDIKYACSKCSDTGITEEGSRCSCVKERMGEAEVWQNSGS